MLGRGGAFICFAALRPKSTAMVMAGRSVHLTPVFSCASLNKGERTSIPMENYSTWDFLWPPFWTRARGVDAYIDVFRMLNSGGSVVYLTQVILLYVVVYLSLKCCLI